MSVRDATFSLGLILILSKNHNMLRQHGVQNQIQQKKQLISELLLSAPPGARTLDPNIKSVVLYQLS